jgi:hypothetical protein
MAPPQRVQIRLLGGFDVQIDGVAVPAGEASTFELIASGNRSTTTD